MKKLLNFTLILLMGLAIIGASACGKPKAQISLDKTTATVNVFASMALVATTKNTEEGVVWRSSNSAIASVDDSGIITPNGVGTVTITATVGKAKAYCVVEVVPPRDYSAKVLSDIYAKTLKIGESFTITPTAFYEDMGENGAYLEGVSYRFASTSNAISVDESGTVVANSVGTATITISGRLKGVELLSGLVMVTVEE